MIVHLFPGPVLTFRRTRVRAVQDGLPWKERQAKDVAGICYVYVTKLVLAGIEHIHKHLIYC